MHLPVQFDYRGAKLKVNMENSQNLQQKPNQPQESTPNLENNPPSFKNLLIQHPWMWLTGLLVIPLTIIIFAWYNLTQTGDVPQAEPAESSTLIVEEPIKTPFEASNPTPLWMVMAIALSCGSGCWMIIRLIKRPKSLQKVRKLAHHHQKALPQGPRQKLNPRLSKKSSAIVPQPSLKSVVRTSPNTKHLVTVVPAEDSHPLDNSTESLADLFDIRKQSSLSSILRHN